MEEMYQYLWFHKMTGRRLRLVTGEDIDIINPGQWNRDSGPDFFNANIKVGGVEWVGNIEIHVKASDWYRHKHDADRAYDSVILHVVAVNDAQVFRSDGSMIMQGVVTLPEDFFQLYSGFCSQSCIKCAERLQTLTSLCVSDWVETLAIERVQNKSERVIRLFEQFSGDWLQTTFVVLARALGFGLNSDPMEMMARSLPLKFALRHSDNLLQLEALVFGQSGLLDIRLHRDDVYYQRLCGEYSFLRKKYSLNPIDSRVWKFARTRPQNFPHRRLARLARYIEGGFSVLSALTDDNIDFCTLSAILGKGLDGYWSSHFLFGGGNGDVEGKKPLPMSQMSVNLLILNAVIPLLYARASMVGNYESGEKLMELMRSLPAENNNIIKTWSCCGLVAKNALESQALIELRKQYCDVGKCFSCRFGHKLMRNALV